MALTLHTKVAFLSFCITGIAVTVMVSKPETCGWNVNEINMTVVIIFGVTISLMCALIWITRHWINSRMKKKKFFQLIKLSMDISSEVLRKVMVSKILSDAKYGGCLQKFLHHEKHYLYHQWQGRTPCCECPDLGCTLRNSKKMKNWLFKKVYNENLNKGTHVKYNGHRISEYCLDCFVPNPSLKVKDFDVTMLSFFIEHYVSLLPLEISSLNDIVSVRNSIFHAGNISSFQPKDLENMWIKLSEALLTLTDIPSRNLLKDQICMIKKVEFDSTDIEILKEKVEREGQMLEEICKFMNQNGVTKDCIKETETIIVSHINTKTECLQDDVKALKEGQLVFADQQEKTGDKLGIIIEMLHAITIEAHVYAERKSITGDDTGELTDRLIDAVGRIDNENIDERLVVENITKSSDTDDNRDKFRVVSAKQSCIILYLECSPYVLKSEQSFRSAVKSLLLDIVETGNIDTLTPATIVLELKFCSQLTEDEINIIKHIVVRERETQNVSSPQGVKKIKKNFEVYKISSFKSQVLEITTKYGIIIMTDESHIPAEADVEVRLWVDPNFTLNLPARVINNVVEFYVPWNLISHVNQLQVSVFDKQMQIETSKQTIELKINDQNKKDNKLKHEDSRNDSGESGFRSDREDDTLESIGPFYTRRVVPHLANYLAYPYLNNDTPVNVRDSRTIAFHHNEFWGNDTDDHDEM